MILLFLIEQTLLFSEPTQSEVQPVPPNLPESSSYQITEKPSPKFEMLINVPSTEMILFQDGKLVQKHKISVGAPSHPTPLGKMQIGSFEWNPWWYPPKADWAKNAKITPPGPGNPLGPVKLLVENSDIRIHGTDKPSSIGKAASHGCLRMNNKDAKSIAQYIQEETFQEKDPNIYSSYEKNKSKTVKKTLDENQKVWAYVIYEPVLLECKQLIIYPNFYGKKINYEEKVEQVLEKNAYAKNLIHSDELKKVIKNQKGKKLYFSLEKLAKGSKLEDSLSHEAKETCLSDQWAALLDYYRSEYNSELKPLVKSASSESQAP